MNVQEREFDVQAAPPHEQYSAAVVDRQPSLTAPWNFAQLIGFRFIFIYLILFFLTGQEVGHLPFSTWLVEKYTLFWHHNEVWVAKHILHLSYPITVFENGSGDTTANWVQLLCYVVLAAFGTIIWSIFDRKRRDYRKLNQWFRLILRFSLSFGMILYGMAKFIPNQMPAPGPGMLETRLGDFSPMGLLWTFIGASYAYEVFTGCAELAAGILVLIPRTVLLGSLLAIADMTMVFTLNMAYNVPVKIMSFHYGLMGIVLAAPEFRRLARFFILNKRTEPVVPTPLVRSKRISIAVQMALFLFGIYFIGAQAVKGVHRYRIQNPPVPPIYGVYAVDEFALDGNTLPPLTTDQNRWKEIVFQAGDSVQIRKMASKGDSYYQKTDMNSGTLTLGKYLRGANGRYEYDENYQLKKDPNGPLFPLTFTQPEKDILTLDGQLDGHQIHAKMKKVNFVLTTKGFHWINETPN